VKKSVFVFHEHTLQYPEGPDVHWDIRVKANSHLEEWNIYEDPLKLEPGEIVQVSKKICRDVKWLTYDKKWIKVGPLWTYVDLLDKGNVDIDQKSPQEVHFNFHGLRFKGEWVLLHKDTAWLFFRKALKFAGSTCSPGIVSDLRDPKGNFKELNADHRYLHVGFVRLKKGGSWGDWSEERIVLCHAEIVDALRKVGYPYYRAGKDDPEFMQELDRKSGRHEKTEPPKGS